MPTIVEETFKYSLANLIVFMAKGVTHRCDGTCQDKSDRRITRTHDLWVPMHWIISHLPQRRATALVTFHRLPSTLDDPMAYVELVLQDDDRITMMVMPDTLDTRIKYELQDQDLQTLSNKVAAMYFNFVDAMRGLA